MNDPRPEPSPEDSSPQSSGPAPILSYATPSSSRMIKLARYRDVNEAELHAAALAAEGISARVLNANMNTMGYPGMADVELHVRDDQADDALAILDQAKNEEMEPVPDPVDAPPPRDALGQEVCLLPAAAFHNLRLMRDAQTVLLSDGINSFPPTLVPRGDRPPGIGKRFVLRVAEADADRARELL